MRVSGSGSSALALAAALVMGCGPELASTVVTGSMEGTSGEESETSDGDKTAWLVISGIVLALGVGLTVAALVEEASYIERHQRDIERGLAGGEGPFASDLAHALSLPESEVGRVKALLRVRHGPIGAELAKLRALGREVEAGDIGGFWREVLAALSTDPTLVPTLERLERRALVLAGRETPETSELTDRAAARSQARGWSGGLWLSSGSEPGAP